MNRINVRDFSNIYSPKNKPLNTKITKTLQLSNNLNSPLKNTLSPRNSSFSSRNTYSPRNTLTPRHVSSRNQGLSTHNTSGNNAQIANIPIIDQARKIQKLNLSKQKINEIKDSLTLDQISKKAYQQRIKTNKFYLKYDKNPLSEKYDNLAQATLQLSQKQKEITLLKAVEDLVKRDNNQKLKNKKNKTEEGVNQIYIKMKRKEERSLNKRNIRKNEMKREEKHEKQVQNEEYLNSPFDELDQIVNLKDENYFMYKRNTEPFNLFQLKFNPNSVMFQSGRQQLSNHYFSFDSMSTNSSASINETMLRALSTYSRISAVKSNSSAIPSDFKIDGRSFRFIDFDKIGLEDILQVANGQMRSEVLLKYMSDDSGEKRQTQDRNSDQQLNNALKDLVILKKNHKNKETSYQANNFQKTELMYLKRDYNTPMEDRQQELSAKYLKKMRVVLAEQLKMLQTTIRDNNIHTAFRREKDKILHDQLDADADMSRKVLQTERKIRMNKVSKNQTEKIKIKEVIKTCRERRFLEKGFKSSSQPRSKSWKFSKYTKKQRSQSNSKRKGI